MKSRILCTLILISLMATPVFYADAAIAMNKRPPQLKYIKLYPNCKYYEIDIYPKMYGVEHNLNFRSTDSRDKIFRYFYNQMKPNRWRMDKLDYTYKALDAYRGRIHLHIYLKNSKKPGFKTDVGFIYRIYSHAKASDVPKPSTRGFEYKLARPSKLPGIPVYPGSVFESGSHKITYNKRGNEHRHSGKFKCTAPSAAVHKYIYGYLNRSNWKIKAHDKPPFVKGQRLHIRAEKEYKASREEIDLTYNVDELEDDKRYKSEYWYVYDRHPNYYN